MKSNKVVITRKFIHFFLPCLHHLSTLIALVVVAREVVHLLLAVFPLLVHTWNPTDVHDITPRHLLLARLGALLPRAASSSFTGTVASGSSSTGRAGRGRGVLLLFVRTEVRLQVRRARTEVRLQVRRAGCSGRGRPAAGRVLRA